MQPVIAVSLQGGDVPGHLSLDRHYIDMLAQLGASLLCVPEVQSEAAVATLLDRVDGLLIPGGHDVDPALYGQTPSPTNDTPVPSRDTMEPRLIRRCWELGMPYLGVCRGAQMANVVLGGTLIQQLSTSPINHQQAEPFDMPSHTVHLEAGSLLERICKRDTLTVNSIHHQAIGKVGANLRVAARATDNTIEAVWAPEKPFFLCIQWHPELSWSCTHNQAIATSFIEAARTFAQNRR